MSRSAKAPTSAAEVSGDGGTGVMNGSTRVIVHWSRTPRRTRLSCSISAHSLGAGGHLNGAPQTPITALPELNASSLSRMPKAPA